MASARHTHDTVMRDTLHLWIEDEMMDSDVSASHSVVQKAEADSRVSTLCVHISSTGGSAYVGYAIYDMLSKCSKHVVTINHGCAFSAASIAFLGGDERWMAPNATLMFHESSTRVRGVDAMIASHLDELRRLNAIDLVILKKLGVRKKMQKRITEEGAHDVFVDAAASLASKLATGVGFPPCWVRKEPKSPKSPKRKPSKAAKRKRTKTSSGRGRSNESDDSDESSEEADSDDSSDSSGESDTSDSESESSDDDVESYEDDNDDDDGDDGEQDEAPEEDEKYEIRSANQSSKTPRRRTDGKRRRFGR